MQKKLPIFFMLIKDLLKRNIAVSRKKLALSLQFDVCKFWFLLIIIGIPEFSNDMSLTAINNQHLWKSGYDVASSAVWGVANELRMHLWTELEHRIHCGHAIGCVNTSLLNLLGVTKAKTERSLSSSKDSSLSPSTKLGREPSTSMW